MFFEHINSASADYPFLVHHNDIKYIPHLHNETEIVYVEEGEVELTLGNITKALKKGEIAVIPCKIIHNIYTKKSSKTFVIKLFPITSLEGIQLKSNILSIEDKGYNTLIGLVNSIISEDKNKNTDYMLAVNIYAQQIFLFILRELKDTSAVCDKTKLLKESSFLNSVNAYLQENYKKSITLEVVSKHFNLTKSYFCRYFKTVTGTSFWNYYTLFRLEKAVELLSGGEYGNLISIAMESGFNNVRSFNKAFKAFHSVTPSEYKKLLLNR